MVVAVCHAGDPAEGERHTALLRTFGTLLADAIAPKPFTLHQQTFDASVPPGLGYYFKSDFTSGLSDEAIDVLVEHNGQALQPWSFTIIFQLGAAFAININGVAEDPANDSDVRSWARACFDALTPHATGGVYVNFLGNEGDERVRAAYGHAYEPLKALKARCDPQNVFRINQNIRPVEPSAG